MGIRTEEVELTNMCMICDGKGNVLVQDKINSSNWCGWNFPGGHVEKGEYVPRLIAYQLKYEELVQKLVKDTGTAV